MPMLVINSAGAQADILNQYLQDLPIVLPKSIWTYSKNFSIFNIRKKEKEKGINYIIILIIITYLLLINILSKSIYIKFILLTEHQSFPWKLEILDFQCYTLKQGERKNFIKQVSFNATIALTTKFNSSESNIKLSSMQLSVYIDTTPIIISASEEQVKKNDYIEIFFLNIISNLIFN